MTEQFTDQQREVLAKVEKLMRLSAKNPNEHEAAAAAAKAQELLLSWNLTSAALEANGGDTGKRAEEKLVGGFYQFERDLWNAIAELNFCWYFNRSKYVPLAERKQHRGRTYTQQHILIGRTVNIAATKSMAEYLSGAIERLTKERLDLNKQHPRSSWAVSYRRGMAERVQEKIEDRRYQMIDEERQKVRDARERGMSTASSSNAITIASVRQSEHEANYDFQFGDGAYAKMKAQRAEQAAAAKAAEDAYTQWAAENPEEAAKDEEKARKEQERRDARRTGRNRSAPAFKGDWSAYRQGREAGEKVGIDLQTGTTRAKELLK